MATARAWVALAMLACLLLVRSAQVVAAEVAEPPKASAVGASARTTGHHCNPAKENCRPGDPDAPENQAEESTPNATPSSGDTDPGAADLDEAVDDQEFIVLGH